MQPTHPVPRSVTLETAGKRIARLRSAAGWTQQALATRLAVSRVAISHIEMDLSVPSERTITLLAGLLKMTPHELVEGTTYPQAKAERLPLVACCYTPLEMELALLENDLGWLERLDEDCLAQRLRQDILSRWAGRLESWRAETVDERQRGMVEEAMARLGQWGG